MEQWFTTTFWGILTLSTIGSIISYLIIKGLKNIPTIKKYIEEFKDDREKELVKKYVPKLYRTFKEQGEIGVLFIFFNYAIKLTMGLLVASLLTISSIVIFFHTTVENPYLLLLVILFQIIAINLFYEVFQGLRIIRVWQTRIEIQLTENRMEKKE